jgi:hypothetical protein
LIRQSASSIPDTSLEKRQESSSGDSNVHLDTHFSDNLHSFSFKLNENINTIISMEEIYDEKEIYE